MPLWFYLLTPFGWLSLYLTFVIFVHELGHLTVGLLTGHKIKKFEVGDGKPIMQFKIKDLSFELSLVGTSGKISVDTTKQVSQIGIFLTAMAGPIAGLLLATGILFLIPPLIGNDYRHNALTLLTVMLEPHKLRHYCVIILATLSFITYCCEFRNLARDFKNILVKKG